MKPTPIYSKTFSESLSLNHSLWGLFRLYLKSHVLQMLHPVLSTCSQWNLYRGQPGPRYWSAVQYGRLQQCAALFSNIKGGLTLGFGDPPFIMVLISTKTSGPFILVLAEDWLDSLTCYLASFDNIKKGWHKYTQTPRLLSIDAWGNCNWVWLWHISLPIYYCFSWVLLLHNCLSRQNT